VEWRLKVTNNSLDKIVSSLIFCINKYFVTQSVIRAH
jgi:hypothetical protein